MNCNFLGFNFRLTLLILFNCFWICFWKEETNLLFVFMFSCETNPAGINEIFEPANVVDLLPALLKS